MLKESVVEKVILCIFNSCTVAKECVSDIFSRTILDSEKISLFRVWCVVFEYFLFRNRNILAHACFLLQQASYSQLLRQGWNGIAVLIRFCSYDSDTLRATSIIAGALYNYCRYPKNPICTYLKYTTIRWVFLVYLGHTCSTHGVLVHFNGDIRNNLVEVLE